MKYVRQNDGKIEIVESSASIPAGAETIFNTDPEVFEGTWDMPIGEEGGRIKTGEMPQILAKHADIVMDGEKLKVQDKQHPGDIPRDTSYIGTKEERAKLKYDPELEIYKHKKMTGWTEPHKAHPLDKVCLECGKPMPRARPNKKFCSQKCQKAYSQKKIRAQKKTIKTFVPHRGTEGQIFYLVDGNVQFIPALWCDTQKRTEKYVKDNMRAEVQDEILKQIRKVYAK